MAGRRRRIEDLESALVSIQLQVDSLLQALVVSSKLLAMSFERIKDLESAMMPSDVAASDDGD